MSTVGTTSDGRLVAGRYRLVEVLGRGGMGAVWRARDDVLDRDVAVKEVTLPPGLTDQDRVRLSERTRREARAAARLHHPSAVTVHDVVEDDGVPFIVMELVPARTLAEVVREDGPLAPARAAEVGLAVLGALEAAHRQGIVHRDVKPGNVLLSEAPPGRVVLTDFGIATTTGDSSITTTGLVLGSPAYISPERARGEQPGPASDLWSLGATLFTAVEGRAPYDAGEALATVTAVVTGDRAPFVAAGPLEPVLEGLLERDPAQRLDAAAARRGLEEVARSRTRRVTPPMPAPADDVRRVDRTTVLPLISATTPAPEPEPVRAQVAPPPPVARPVPQSPVPQSPMPQSTVPPRPVPQRPVPQSTVPPRPVRPARRRRPGAVAAAALGVAALGAVLGVAALHDDGAGGTAARTTAPTAAPTTVPTASAPAADPSAAAGASAAEPSAAGGSRPPADAAPTDGGVVPAGWQTVTAAPGFTAALPASYTAGSFNGFPEYRDRATGRTLRVSYSAPGGGKDDAVQDRRDQAASFAQRHPSYEQIAIQAVDYRGYPAADWEFTYTDGGTPLYVLNRVFVVDGRGWSLYYQTRAGDDRQAVRAEFERIAAAFRPA